MEKEFADLPDKIKEKKKILFIINPVSGKRSSKNILNEINSGIDPEKYIIDVKYSESAIHVTTLTTNAVQANTDIIVAVGGDGTINEVASCLIHSKSTLGIIPTGSGNGLARHVGIPLAIPKAVKLINEAHSKLIDTASINNKAFISIAGVGFDALIARKFATSKKRGFTTYLQYVTNSFIKYKPKIYQLKINEKVIKTKALFISFANSNQFGYNAQIAPNAKLDDGMLDVCVVQKPNLFEMPLIANLVFLKKIDKSQHVDIIPAEKVTVEREKGKYVNIDGEAVKMSKKLEVKVVPLSLKIIIPKDGKKN